MAKAPVRADGLGLAGAARSLRKKLRDMKARIRSKADRNPLWRI